MQKIPLYLVVSFFGCGGRTVGRGIFMLFLRFLPCQICRLGLYVPLGFVCFFIFVPKLYPAISYAHQYQYYQ